MGHDLYILIFGHPIRPVKTNPFYFRHLYIEFLLIIN